MDNGHTEGTQDESATSPSGEYFGRNLYVGRSNRIRECTQRHDPIFGAKREWKIDYFASLVYISHYGGSYYNIDTYKNL